MSLSGIISSTILITSTTIDDAIWLIPYCTSSHLPPSTKAIHALTFICTLETLSIGCIGFYYLMKGGLKRFVVKNGNGTDGADGTDDDDADKISFYMECIGAAICWSIAIFLYIKKMMKRRRKQLQKQRMQQEQQQQQEQPLLLEQNVVEQNVVEQYQLFASIRQQQQLQTPLSNTNNTLGQYAIHGNQTVMSIEDGTNTTQTNTNTNTYTSTNPNTDTYNNVTTRTGGTGTITTINTTTNVQRSSTSMDDSSFNSNSNHLVTTIATPTNNSNLVTNMNDVISGQQQYHNEQQHQQHHESSDDNDDNDDDDNDDDDINTIPTTPSIAIIISLTTLGALDEISYFPALIMGKIFTPFELCTGAFFASIIILIVINFFLARFKPLVDWLDSIPLYGIVGMFAIVLTLGLFL